jgi:glycosyltransferase involved in cell wall biosynthesis
MLRGHDIVCFANDWRSDPTSKKHVLRRLARDNRVLWVNSIGCRTPRVNARDARRVARKAGELLRGVEPVAANLWTLSPCAVPLHGAAWARAVNRRLLRAHVRWAARRLGMRDFITWTFVPTSAPVAGRLGEKLLVYHCVDEFAEFSGVAAESVRALEADLARRADLVVVSAQRLLDDKRRHNARTVLVRHGVDVDLFRRALDASVAVPDDLASAPRPLAGFFGLLADWVDVPLLTALARERPGWTFAFVGPVETPVDELAALPNVRLLGRRPYEALPGYSKGFDVALLPFRLNELTRSANPLKLREYLAAGLPVISSDLPEAAALGDLVRIARSEREWLAALDAIAAGGGRGPLAERADAVRGESWDAKVEELSRHVEAALARRTSGLAWRKRGATAGELAEDLAP